jgi:hypothetical protein
LNVEWTTGPMKWSPLHVAICRGHVGTAKLLLKRNASTTVGTHQLNDLHDVSALDAAAWKGLTDLVVFILEHGYHDGNVYLDSNKHVFSPLYLSILGGHAETTGREFLARGILPYGIVGAYLDLSDPRWFAKRSFLEMLVQHDQFSSALQYMQAGIHWFEEVQPLNINHLLALACVRRPKIFEPVSNFRELPQCSGLAGMELWSPHDFLNCMASDTDQNRLRFVEYLLKKGADAVSPEVHYHNSYPHREPVSVLVSCLSEGLWGVARVLLENGAVGSWLALATALKTKTFTPVVVSTIRMLLDSGAPTRGVWGPVYGQHLDRSALEILLLDSIELFEKPIWKYFDLDPLAWASFMAIVQMLVEHGAPVYLGNSDYDYATMRTVLEGGLEHGRPELTKTLVEHGVLDGMCEQEYEVSPRIWLACAALEYGEMHMIDTVLAPLMATARKDLDPSFAWNLLFDARFDAMTMLMDRGYKFDPFYMEPVHGLTERKLSAFQAACFWAGTGPKPTAFVKRLLSTLSKAKAKKIVNLATDNGETPACTAINFQEHCRM